MSSVPDYFAKVTREESEVLFCCHDVYKFQENTDMNAEVSYGCIAKLAAEEFRKAPFHNVYLVKSFFQFYKKNYQVDTLAGLKHHYRMKTDHDYKELVELEGNDLERRGIERMHVSGLRSNLIDRNEATAVLYRYLQNILQYVSQTTITSDEMWRHINTEVVQIGFDDFRRIALQVVSEGKSLIGLHLPPVPKRVSDARRIELEIEHAHNVIVFVGYGHRDSYSAQRELLYLDLNRLSKFATYQTLASEECYIMLGERFRYFHGDGLRNRLKERLQHVMMLGELMDRSDAIEMARLRKRFEEDYKNFTTRRQEMAILMHRFDFPFSRVTDESDLRGLGEDLFKTCSALAIFYGMLHEARVSLETPKMLDVIDKMLQEGVVSSKFSSQEWMQVFKEKLGNILVPEAHRNAIRYHFRSCLS